MLLDLLDFIYTCNMNKLMHFQVLTEYIVQDLNVNPKLPFDDNTFDVITNVVCSLSVHFLSLLLNISIMEM